MNLARYFASSKKRDLSSEQSEPGDDMKNIRENSSLKSSDNERLKSDNFRSILATCFKNIQEKIEELFVFVMVRKNNKTQIKGEKQLEDLTDSVKFMLS